jgi:hypothetical protein
MKPIIILSQKVLGRVCNKHGFIFGGGICDKCRSEKIDEVLSKGPIQRIKIWLKYQLQQLLSN